MTTCSTAPGFAHAAGEAPPASAGTGDAGDAAAKDAAAGAGAHGRRRRPGRPRRLGRLLRTVATVVLAACVAVPVSAAARPGAVPAPAPARPAPLRSADPAALSARYAASREAVRAAERTAADHGDTARAAALHGMASPSRTFLSFDGRDGGRTTEVFGDLSRARHVAVFVPGSDTDLDRYARLRDGAAALQRALGPGGAVVAWLGYRTPATVGPAVLTPRRADGAAPGLRRFVHRLRVLRPDARLSVLCHSYGTVVCGRAAPGLDAASLVLFGSPGVGVRDAAALHTRAAVWAGRSRGDWIARVPHVRLHLPFGTVGLGGDPVSAGFGAHVFAAGRGGHSDYLKPGSRSLSALARIASGRAPDGPPPGASPAAPSVRAAAGSGHG